MIEIHSSNVVASCIRTVPLRVRFVKRGCPPEPVVVVVSEVCAGGTALKGLEKAAREAKKALWADPQPVPLWEWRKGEK